MKPSRRTYLILAAFALLIAAAAVWFVLSPPQRKKSESPSSVASRQTDGQTEKQSAAAQDSTPAPRTKSAERPADASRTGKLDDDFNPANYQRRPMGDTGNASSGAALAYVQIPSSNRRAALQPNSYGEYETQASLTGETVGVRLRIEDVSPGTPVSVVILDGGKFPDSTGPSKVIKLGNDSQISFRFTASANTGHHRIRVLPSGGTPRLLDFNATES